MDFNQIPRIILKHKFKNNFKFSPDVSQILQLTEREFKKSNQK